MKYFGFTFLLFCAIATFAQENTETLLKKVADLIISENNNAIRVEKQVN